jgi:hypothetical protein
MRTLRPPLTAFAAPIVIAAAMTILLAAPRHAGAETAAEIDTKIEKISEREHQLDLRIHYPGI